MADAPAPPFAFPCPWCPFKIVVNARGSRGRRRGAGEEAADIMNAHVIQAHQKTWREFLLALTE